MVEMSSLEFQQLSSALANLADRTARLEADVATLKARPSPRTYTVRPGDTLSGIAWRHQTTINALMQANDLYSDFIYSGQRLCVPPGGAAWQPSAPAAPKHSYYTVRPGDTLMAVAWRFGVSQAALLRANNISNPNFIYVGQRLIIPGVARPASRHKVSRIVFARWDGSKHDLYVANTDGSDEKLLLERAAGPSWSPDGQMVAFYGAEGVDRQPQEGTEVHFESISNGILTVPVVNWPGDISQLNLVQIQKEGSARAAAWAASGDAQAGLAQHVVVDGL